MLFYFFLNARQTLFGKLHINSQQQINRSNSVCIIVFTMKKLCHNGCFCRSMQIPGPCNLFRCVCGTSEVCKLFIWVQEEGEGKKMLDTTWYCTFSQWSVMIMQESQQEGVGGKIKKKQHEKPQRSQNKRLAASLMQPCNKQNYRSAWLRFTFVEPQKLISCLSRWGR